jgi:2-oxoglutarate ferredoxin oxidoreductase subunit beta
MTELKKVFSRPKSLTDKPYHFCPGCNHGIIHRLVGEALDEYELVPRTTAVASVGCSVFLYDYFAVDVLEAPHGRAPAVATGVKRSLPNNIVFTYQGDGDLASIGMSEIVHTANRGEPITVIFVNNTVYGMTGGQMAPTTMLGQKTTTSPYGREYSSDGYPIRMAEMLATLEGAAFVARVAVNKPKNVIAAKKVIKKAFKMQIDGIGFSFVEVVSTCPTNWRMTPKEAAWRVEEELLPYFPLGVFKERTMSDVM